MTLKLKLAVFQYRHNIHQWRQKCVENWQYPWHNAGCFALMCRCVQGKCSTEIKDIYPPIMFSNRTTCFPQRSHSLVLELPVYRTTRNRGLSLFNGISRLWNNLPTAAFCAVSEHSMVKSNIHKHYSLSSPNSFYNPS